MVPAGVEPYCGNGAVSHPVFVGVRIGISRCAQGAAHRILYVLDHDERTIEDRVQRLIVEVHPFALIAIGEPRVVGRGCGRKKLAEPYSEQGREQSLGSKSTHGDSSQISIGENSHYGVTGADAPTWVKL
jgi:hypothetical protein